MVATEGWSGRGMDILMLPEAEIQESLRRLRTDSIALDDLHRVDRRRRSKIVWA